MRNEELYLRDIVEACEAIGDFIGGLRKATVLNTDIIISAVVRKFEIIGEASSKLSTELRDEHPEIDWKSIIGFRNILIHQYFASNLDIVWEAASQHVEPLKEHVKAILKFRYPDDSA